MTSPTFVVPLDGSAYSERALPIATALAQRANGRLLLLAAEEHGALHPAEYLDEIAARPGPVPVETRSFTDTDVIPAAAIGQVIRESADRIACMTSHGRGGLRWALLGSVAEEVMRRADRPTLLVGRHCRENFLTDARYLLACVDGSDSAAELAPVAIDWAARLALDVHIANVAHPLDVESAEHPEKFLDPIVEGFGGSDHVAATLLRSRFPEGALADYARDISAAIVAVNSHCRTGVARFALGSTSMGLVSQAPCPVLVTPRST
ncbi:MAG TPA: universal stress protein [Acidimicrobiia bacterium]|jgi:nucleotide-binding universal stress UspA family protein|nr:universal stress protein [Acidimicrobiia bacterium]